MREHPWHQRRPTAHHHLWYRNLMELHQVTQEWVNELKLPRPSHFLGHKASPEVRETVARLEGAVENLLHPDEEGGLDRLLDDTSPDSLLTRLQNSVETLQGWSLRGILDRTPDSERAKLMGQLEQGTWKRGRACASERYGRLPAASREDLRTVLAAAEGLPLHPDRLGPAFLLERALRDELQLELHHCAHRSRNPALLAVADPLCSLQDAWVRGFLYELNPRIRLEKSRAPGADGRCRHRWWLPVQ